MTEGLAESRLITIHEARLPHPFRARFPCCAHGSFVDIESRIPRLEFYLSNLRRSLARAGYTFPWRRRSTASTLNGKSAHTPRSSAPPAAEKTEKLRGAFTPSAAVIVRAKVVRSAPLSKATTRVFQPRARRRPKSVSAVVAIIANAGIIAAGKNQMRVAV